MRGERQPVSEAQRQWATHVRRAFLEVGVPLPLVSGCGRRAALLRVAAPCAAAYVDGRTVTCGDAEMAVASLAPVRDVPRFDGVTIHDLSQGRRLAAATTQYGFWPIGFSSDASMFAFVGIAPDGITLRVACLASGTSRRVSACRLSAAPFVLGSQSMGAWSGRTGAVVTFRPADEPSPLDRDEPAAPSHPRFRTQPVLIDIASGRCIDIGMAGYHVSAEPSADGRQVMTVELIVGRTPIRSLAALPNRVSLYSVASPMEAIAVEIPANATLIRWHPFRPDVLTWIRLEEDGRTALSFFDTVGRRAPVTMLHTDSAVKDYWWTTAGRLVLSEFGGEVATRIVSFGPDGTVSGETSAPSHDGVSTTFLFRSSNGGAQIIEDARGIFVTQLEMDGAGASAVSTIDPTSGRMTQRWSLGERSHVYVRSAGDLSVPLLLCEREFADVPPQLVLIDPTSHHHVRLTGRRPRSFMGTVARQPLTAVRSDGVPIRARLYRPAVGEVESDICLVWLYPRVLGSRPDGPTRPVRECYDRIDGRHHLALMGYSHAVLDVPDLPILFDSAKAERTFVAQLVDGVEALVRAITEIAPGRRIVVGGRCLGAYAAALLLAHTDRFAGGILCSGFYDLQFARVSRALLCLFGDEPSLSPSHLAERITAPVLLTYGEHEGPPVDAKAQSESFAERLASGLVTTLCLPGESHRASALVSSHRLIDEMARWCECSVIATVKRRAS